MHYKGHVENGVVVLDEPVNFPDGTLVQLWPVKLPAGQHHPDVDRFAGVIAAESESGNPYYEHLRKKHQ